MKLFKKAHSSNVHIMIGFGILILLYYFNQSHQWVNMELFTNMDYIFMLFITWIYSQMPDSDQPGSKINKYVTIFGVGVIIYSFYYGYRTLGIATAVILGLFRIIEHRTVIHSLVGALAFSVPLYFIKPIYGIIAFIMFIAHVVSEGEFSVFWEKDWKLLK